MSEQPADPPLPEAPRPLAGIRVVEFAGLGPGPFATMLLTDAGADTLRVDRPGPAKDGGALVRGRPRLELDLKSEAGRRVAMDLVGVADVIIEGFRPGVMERLGLGPEDCLGVNPRLVYGRMTGWGQEGPRSQQPGHDINYLALTGALRSISRKGQAPVPPMTLVADYGGGGMLLAFGILTALLERGRSGRGQVVDAAMVDGVSLLMTGIWSRAAQGRWPGEPGTNELDTGAPFYDIYATSDGAYMAVGCIEPQFWLRMLDRLGLDPAELPDQWDRSAWPQMKAVIGKVFVSRSRADWTAMFDEVDACVTPVLRLQEAPSDPHLMARGSLLELDGHTAPAPAPRLSRTPLGTSSPTSCDDLLRRWAIPPCGPGAT